MHEMRRLDVFLADYHVTNQMPDEVWSFQTQHCMYLQIYFQYLIQFGFLYRSEMLRKHCHEVCYLWIKKMHEKQP